MASKYSEASSKHRWLPGGVFWELEICMQKMESSSEAENGSRGCVAYNVAAIPFVSVFASVFACIFALGRLMNLEGNLGSFPGR